MNTGHINSCHQIENRLEKILPSSSKSFTKFSTRGFLQSIPLHSPHALPQGHPFFLHLKSSVPHCFGDELLQLQRILDRRDSGAAGISVMIGWRTFEILFHPQSHGFNPQSMFSFSHLLISRYTLREWKWAALSDGDRLAGSTSFASRIAFRGVPDFFFFQR